MDLRPSVEWQGHQLQGACESGKRTVKGAGNTGDYRGAVDRRESK